MKRVFACFSIALTVLMLSAAAFAQTYPNKPITVLLGVPPGTSLDASLRIVGGEMGKRLGQQVVLEFRPGANQTIAAKAVASALPDGYTLWFGNAPAVYPLFTRNNALDVSKELSTVVDVMTTPFYLMASGKLPVTSFKELLAYSKGIPDGVTAGATVEIQDLIMGLLKDRTGLVSRSIPYKGSSQTVIAVLSGELDVSIGSITAYLPHLQSGAARVLFIAAPERSSQFPNLPTAAEVGIPNFNLALDYGLFAPLGTPRDIIQRLAAATAAATRVPGVVDQIRKFGSEPMGSTPEEQMSRLESVMKFWGDYIRQTGFKPK